MNSMPEIPISFAARQLSYVSILGIEKSSKIFSHIGEFIEEIDSRDDDKLDEMDLESAFEDREIKAIADQTIITMVLGYESSRHIEKRTQAIVKIIEINRLN